MRLLDKIAIVSGASQGIGKGIALELAKEGADVVVNYHQYQEGAAEVENRIHELGRRCLCVQGDVSLKTDVRELVRRTRIEFGSIDILVNNAGILIPGPISDLSEEHWDRVIQVNLKGAFLMSQAVGKHMIASRAAGAIVNVASISAHLPEIYDGAYTPSKAGVVALTRLLAAEWAPYRIRVNSVSPGPVMTPLQRRAFPTKALLDVRNQAVPMGRHGTPEEIAKTVVFLVSDDAAYLTGADIPVDGGSLGSMFHLIRKYSDRM